MVISAQMKKLNFIYTSILVLLLGCSPVEHTSVPTEKEIETVSNPVPEIVPANKIFPTGREPKQVLFSDDCINLIVPLLQGPGISLINTQSGAVRCIEVPDYGSREGFVEAVFNPTGTLLYVSQMTTGMIHVFSPEAEYLHSFSSGGDWSKVIAFSPDGAILAVSNWLSNTVTIIDTVSEKVLTYLSSDGAEVPRGVVFTRDGSSVLVAFFGSGDIVLYSTANWEEMVRIHTGGAPRHIVLHPAKPLAYISNMASRKVHILNLENQHIIADLNVGPNPNTIDLNPDGSRLYVSCRGLNNPEDYTLPSPENGEVHEIDTITLETVRIIPGGNQPTGLDVSGDGRFLAFTNFQDNTVELRPLF